MLRTSMNIRDTRLTERGQISYDPTYVRSLEDSDSHSWEGDVEASEGDGS